MARPRLIHLADGAASLKRRLRRRPGAAHGVLVVAAGGLGDAVLFALVAPRFLALARPGEPVTVLWRQDAAKMAFLLPPEARVDSVDFARLRGDLRYRLAVLDRLHAANYRLVVSTDYLRHPDLDESLVRAAAAAETVAMEPRPSPKHGRALRRHRGLYDRLFASGEPRRDKVLRWTAFADWLSGGRAPPPLIRLPADRLPPPAALEFPTVLIQPFSAVAYKQSPLGLWRRVIAALPEGFRVRITGAPADLERNPEYRTLLAPPRITFEASGFEDLVAVLRAVKLVVSVDTALMHLAVAVGAPTLALASAAFVGEIVPYARAITPDNVHVLYRPMPCEGCLGACVLAAENGMYPCVARLDADAVVAAVRRLIAGEGRAP